MAKIILELEKCVHNQNFNINFDCPFSDSERTPNSGYAVDYFCMLFTPPKKTSGYVEWNKDINPVPDFCPIRIDRTEIKKTEQEKFMGEGI